MEWERARIRNSPKPRSSSRPSFLHNTRQFRVSHSVVQFDQEQGAFHTELI